MSAFGGDERRVDRCRIPSRFVPLCGPQWEYSLGLSNAQLYYNLIRAIVEVERNTIMRKITRYYVITTFYYEAAKNDGQEDPGKAENMEISHWSTHQVKHEFKEDSSYTSFNSTS